MVKEIYIIDDDESSIMVFNKLFENDPEFKFISVKSEQIDLIGFEQSHIQILAALTRLRQICCHPGLFISDFKQGSSKLDQCVEILEEATEAGHKILLFSGYTSMFEFIEKELKERNIKYLKLTGATKVDERIELVDKFNEDSDVKVFLISLKAGGTGLN